MNDLIAQGRNLLGTGDFNLARDHFQRAIQGAGNDSSMLLVEAYLGLGLCDKAQNQFNTAAGYFEKAVHLYPNVAAIENLIEIYQATGESKKQADAAKRALALQFLPQDLRAKYLTIAGIAGNA
jgi:tetratricopeptide (TPR) repeat protein